jgi:hypothetical protein
MALRKRTILAGQKNELGHDVLCASGVLPNGKEGSLPYCGSTSRGKLIARWPP